MQPIKITVAGAQAHVTSKPTLTSGTVGLNVEFTFDEAWTGLSKTAVFRCGNRPIPPQSCKEDCAIVPWEALEKPGCALFVGVYGTDTEGIVLPTVWAQVYTVEPGATVPNVSPSDRTPDVYDELLKASNEAVEVANSVREDADAGKFDGAPGLPGPPGAPGKTPEKGVDYWTPADKAEMAQEVLAALPTYNGEVMAV